MPKPIKKKVIKKVSAEDEVRNTYEKFVNYYEENSKNINFTLIIVAIVIVAAVLIYSSVQRSSKTASVLHAQAYRAYIDAVTQNDPALYEQAFNVIGKSNGIRRSAILTYYESDLYEKKGEIDRAIEVLEGLTAEFRSDELVMPLAYAKLGMLYRKKGDLESASKTLEILEKSSYPVLRDFAMYIKAGIQRRMGNQEEVEAINARLIELYPGSPYAREVAATIKAREEAENKKAEKGEQENRKEEE
ncbi:MAG: tetratricopeptide repeat protein [Nitrospirota bacterium]|nr:MAG: tetratricopeptide repeat protein [Nitrospirota bacterium]